jgi:hypothetical protein
MNMFVAGSTVVFWFIALAGGIYWGRRYVRAIEGQTAGRDRIAALEARLAAIEAARPDVAPALTEGAHRRDHQA